MQEENKKSAIDFRLIDASDKEAVINALINYKKKNPVKFEMKKEALFKKYGLELDTPVEPVKDETDIKLDEIKAKVVKEKKAKKSE